jgi:hypothetical protein
LFALEVVVVVVAAIRLHPQLPCRVAAVVVVLLVLKLGIPPLILGLLSLIV